MDSITRESDGSTLPATPQSFSEDVATVEEQGIFAWLRPFNRIAREAFDATVNTTIKHPLEFEHARKFLHITPTRERRLGSVFTEDEDSAADPEPVSQWIGAFKYSLKNLPRNPGRGWYLGTGRGPSRLGEVDILLAPPTDSWAKLGIASKHARLFFHLESCRVVLEARHTVTIGRDGSEVFRQSNSRVLEQGGLISIGDCVYTFEFTDHFATSEFNGCLSRFMKKYSDSEWSMNQLLSPASVGAPRSIGNYYCSPSAFAQGSFGKVSAGWTKEGTAVAIKHFKNPKRDETRVHQLLMEYIGRHDNILQLLDCIGQFDTPVPDAYCVYSPLAVASLTDVIASYQSDLPARLALFRDFSSGLSYLHDDKGMMHRDINPNNLAVLSFNHPKGIILDLDSVTRARDSTNHHKGTMSYLAPEIIELKDWEEKGPHPPPYTNSVDIWALGLSMFALHSGQHWRWGYFLTGGETSSEKVTRPLYEEFQKRMRRHIESCSDSNDVQLLEQIEAMTRYDSFERTSASKLFIRLSVITRVPGKGTIGLKGPPKRSFEE